MLANEAIDLAVGLARRFEGFRAAPYLDPVGIPTIGFGFTRYLDGRLVRLTDEPLARIAADVLLRALMADTARRVFLLFPTPTLTAGRLAALSDFAYNLGLPRLRGSNLRVLANRENWSACPTEFRKWRLAGGKVLPGLVLRREAEIALLN